MTRRQLAIAVLLPLAWMAGWFAAARATRPEIEPPPCDDTGGKILYDAYFNDGGVPGADGWPSRPDPSLGAMT